MVVVLPTPPFWFATAMMRGSGRCGADGEPSVTGARQGPAVGHCGCSGSTGRLDPSGAPCCERIGNRRPVRRRSTQAGSPQVPAERHRSRSTARRRMNSPLGMVGTDSPEGEWGRDPAPGCATAAAVPGTDEPNPDDPDDGSSSDRGADSPEGWTSLIRAPRTERAHAEVARANPSPPSPRGQAFTPDPCSTRQYDSRSGRPAAPDRCSLTTAHLIGTPTMFHVEQAARTDRR